MEDGASAIDAFVLSLTGKAHPRICFLPTPSGDLPEHIEKFYVAYPSTRAITSHLAFFRRPSPGSVQLSRCAEHLLEQDAIYVGGGNTKSALGVWREWGIDSVLARAYSSGILLCGMSAGAMCWFEAGLTDSFWGAGYQPLPCLGFLPGACGVHYQADAERRLRLLEAVEARAIPPAVAIDDFAAVLYENECLSRVVSWKASATAYALSLKAGRAKESRHEAVAIGGVEA